LLVRFGDLAGQRSIFVRADAISALVVALIVIYVSVRLGKRTVDALLDSAPRGLAEQITAAVSRIDGVRKVAQVRLRGSGSQVFVDLRIAVPRHLSFEASHAITSQVHEAVHAIDSNADVVVDAVPTGENEGVLETIEAVAHRNHFDVHNITMHSTKSGVWVDLDLEVDPGLSFESAHSMATDLESRLSAELNLVKDATFGRIADINVHIEPHAKELVTGSELMPGDTLPYLEQIEATILEVPHARECQDVTVQQMEGKVYLAFHLLIDSDQSVADVHSISEEMENRLRRLFPELGRVVIHAEPHLKLKTAGEA